MTADRLIDNEGRKVRFGLERSFPMNYDSFKKVTCHNHNLYMIHSSDRFGITEHREPPHGQQVVINELINE